MAEYVKMGLLYQRICHNHPNCEGCPFKGSLPSKEGCIPVTEEDFKTIEKIALKWEQENPLPNTDLSTFKAYEEFSRRTSSPHMTHRERLVEAMLGLTGEAGECADFVKKGMYQGHNMVTADLVNELGDVLWYLREACDALGVPLQSIAEANIEKLWKRYPNGFSPERSINREE